MNRVEELEARLQSARKALIDFGMVFGADGKIELPSDGALVGRVRVPLDKLTASQSFEHLNALHRLVKAYVEAKRALEKVRGLLGESW